MNRFDNCTMNSGSDFSGVKVGDRLWLRTDCYEGWVNVTDKKVNATYPITFEFFVDGLKYRTCITLSGRVQPNGTQVLFYDKVEITPPPRPKRMVKKMVMVRPFNFGSNLLKVTSEDLHDNSTRWCGPVQLIEIEVEE